jgi:hypothetical protein
LTFIIDNEEYNHFYAVNSAGIGTLIRAVEGKKSPLNALGDL